MKKILISIITILIILALGWFGFVIFYNNLNDGGEDDGNLEFFPTGAVRDIFSGENNNEQQNITNPPPSNDPLVVNEGNLSQITESEVAGFKIGSENNQEELTFVEQATGNFYTYNPSTRQSKQLTNTTIPAVKKAWINPSGDNIHAVLGFIENTGPQVVSVSADVSLATSSVTQLEDEETLIDFITTSYSPNKNRIFILQELNNESVGIVKNLTTGESSQIFSSPFKNWTAEWGSGSAILLKSKGSFNVPGLVGILNPNNGNFSIVLSNIYGLTAKMSPDGQKILYTEKTGTILQTNILNTTNNQKTQLTFSTLADKCVWLENSTEIYCGVNKTLPSGELPDIWYQGKFAFNDGIWKVNTETQAVDFIYQPSNNSQVIDISNPALNSDESSLFFINKEDSKIWSYDLDTTNREIDTTN